MGADGNFGMRCGRALAAIVLGLFGASSAANAQASRPYGVIEIGSKGIKGYLFDLDKAETDPACSEQDDTYAKCLDTRVLATTNVNPLERSALDKTVLAVKAYQTNLTTSLGVEPERVFIVGSSGIAGVAHKGLLVDALKSKVRSLNPIEFLTVEQEATFAFRGLIGMLPSKWRELRQRQAAVIDIGSGNIKASFMTKSAGAPTMATFGLDAGTKRATDDIDATRGGVEFAEAAVHWRRSVFAPSLRKVIDDNQEITNRNRIYLIGGIVWAMVTIHQPDDKSKFPLIKPDLIDGFNARLERDAAGGQICDDKTKERWQGVAKVCDTFSRRNMIAGAQVLKGLSDELDFVRGRKRIFFFRDALSAWPLGYLQDKLYGSSRP